MADCQVGSKAGVLDTGMVYSVQTNFHRLPARHEVPLTAWKFHIQSVDVLQGLEA